MTLDLSTADPSSAVERYGTKVVPVAAAPKTKEPRQEILPGFHDVMTSGGYRKYFQPQEFVGDLLRTPEAKNYANVEGTARTAGVQAIRAGENDQIKSSKQKAANQGLGRGYAGQMESDIRQRGTEGTTDMILAARDEENSRRYQQLSMYAESLISANKAQFAKYLQKKALKAQSEAATMGLIGSALGAVGGIAGGLLGGIGGAAGGAAKSGFAGINMGQVAGQASSAVGGQFGV